MPDKKINPEVYRKLTRVVVAAVLTISISGFFMGLRQTSSTISLSRPPEAVHVEAPETPGQAPTVVEYFRLPDVNYKPNSDWENKLAKLLPRGTNLLEATPFDEQARAAAVAARTTRRAYDGAPPVVPHPVDQLNAASCLACHGEGKVIKDRVAAKVSHPHYTSCTQCHVPSAGPGVIGTDDLKRAFTVNAFVGTPPPGLGQRAWQGAPPTIPHTTLMRQDCMSCHGTKGVAGLRTSHPSRQSCTQCHAPNADLDQQRRPEFTAFPPGSKFLETEIAAQ